MNQYTNQISKLKSFPKLSIFGKIFKKKNKTNNFVRAIQNRVAAEQQAAAQKKAADAQAKIDAERRAKEAKALAEARERQRLLDAKRAKENAERSARNDRISKIDTDVFDREFADFKLAYTPPPPERAVTEKQTPILPTRPVVDIIPPTPDEYKLYREYDSKGIFFKTNLKAVTNRDDNGNILIMVGEEIAQTVSIDGQAVVKVENIPAPKSGHSKISLNINKKD